MILICVSMATCTSNVWCNVLSHICRSIGHHFKHSVDALIIILWKQLKYLISPTLCVDFSSSRLYGHLPMDVYKYLATHNVTMNYHQFGITPLVIISLTLKAPIPDMVDFNFQKSKIYLNCSFSQITIINRILLWISL